MLHKLFTIYDEKAEIFIPPFFVPTIGLAIRAFTDCVNDDEHQFGRHPQDYTLFEIGEFDDSTALIITGDKKSIGNGVEFINSQHVSAFEEFENAPNSSIQPNQKG